MMSLNTRKRYIGESTVIIEKKGRGERTVGLL